MLLFAIEESAVANIPTLQMRKGYAMCPGWSGQDWNPGSWPSEVMLLAIQGMTSLEGNMSQVLGVPPGRRGGAVA